jgi:hypothetical protein
MTQDGRNKNGSQFVKWSITISAIVLIVVHATRPELRIDYVTLVLFAFAAAPWLGGIVDSIKLPGGGQIDYNKGATEENFVDEDLTPEQIKTRYATKE